ncbi:hypothetical protein Bbelb_282630 [Branchiostoma belcheri]|nr:hypothetical protein Bbelb_282630 [Branchiostoma belcheri]
MVLSGDKHTRRDWLHSRAAKIVDPVFAEDMSIGKGVHEGCDRVYVRPKARVTHELKKHNLVVNEAVESSSDTFKEHYVFNYHNAKLGMSLQLTNIQDATKEGDGERDLLKKVKTLQATVDGLQRGNLGVRAIFRDIRSALTAHLIPSAVQREKTLWMWSPGSSRGQPTGHPARGAGVRTHRPRGGYRRTCVSLLRHLQFGPAD